MRSDPLSRNRVTFVEHSGESRLSRAGKNFRVFVEHQVEFEDSSNSTRCSAMLGVRLGEMID